MYHSVPVGMLALSLFRSGLALFFVQGESAQMEKEENTQKLDLRYLLLWTVGEKEKPRASVICCIDLSWYEISLF